MSRGKTLQSWKIPREWYVLLAIIAAWLAFRLWYLAPRLSDAHHVVYAGYLLTQGLTLYQDIFYTSPPLLPYLYAGIGRVFGFGWVPFNVLGILLTAVDAVVLYALAAKWWSRKVGLLAATMFLFSFTVLATTDFLSGIHVTLTLMLLGMLAYSRERHTLSGVLFGLAALSKIYTVIVYGPLVLAYLVAKRWRRLFSSVVPMAAVFGVTIGWLAVRHGGTFLALVFGDHFGKFGTLEGLSKSAINSYFLKHDPWLILGAVVGLAMMALVFRTVRFKEGLKLPEIHHLLLPIFLSAGFLSFFFMFPDVYYFYLKILTAWLALIIAAGAYYLVADDSPRWLASLPTVLMILAIGSSGYLYLTEQAQAAVVTDYAAIRQFVDQQTASDEPLYGAFELVPLLALDLDRPIFNNHFNTIAKYFDLGVFDYRERMIEIRDGHLRTIITKAYSAEGSVVIPDIEGMLPEAVYGQLCHQRGVFPLQQDYTRANTFIVWECLFEGIGEAAE